MPWRVALAATLLATGAVAVADLPVHANIGPIEHRRTSNQCPLYPPKRTSLRRICMFAECDLRIQSAPQLQSHRLVARCAKKTWDRAPQPAQPKPKSAVFQKNCKVCA